MRSYITGGHGFIGSRISQKIGGTVTSIPHEQITSFKYEPFDYFFFCSAYGNLSHQTDTLQSFQANIIDPLHAIMQAVKVDFKCFVFISTSSVKLRTQTMYSRFKKSTEEIMLAYLEKYNKPIVIIRPYSCTGVGEQKEHLIPSLIRSCIDKKPMNFVPHPTHDYIDVDDVAEGIITLAKHQARGVFELGTGIKTTNQQVLELVEKETHNQAVINYVDSMRPYDNEEWVSTNFKARGYGWLPTKTLQQSIKEMVQAYVVK